MEHWDREGQIATVQNSFAVILFHYLNATSTFFIVQTNQAYALSSLAYLDAIMFNCGIPKRKRTNEQCPTNSQGNCRGENEALLVAN